MSISNLLYPNDYKLFAKSITADEEIIEHITATTIDTTNLNATTIDTTTLNATDVNTTNLSFNASPSGALNYYIEEDLTEIALIGPWTTGPTCVFRLSRLNKTVTISQTNMAVANMNGVAAYITCPTPLPLQYRPINSSIFYKSLYVVDRGVAGSPIVILGTVQIDPATGFMTFSVLLANTFSGTAGLAGGLSPFSFSYNISN